MKKIFIVILAFCYSCSDRKSIENEKNLKKVSFGMSHSSVLDIMGTPNGSYKMIDDSLRFNVYYEAPFGFSDNFIIYFSKKDSLVVAINDGL